MESASRRGEADLEAPAEWRARLDALWSTALEGATAEFDVEREELTSKLQASDAENQVLVNDVIQAEARIIDVERATSLQAHEHVVELAAEQSRASRAEGTLEAVSAERDRLLAEVQAGRSSSRD